MLLMDAGWKSRVFDLLYPHNERKAFKKSNISYCLVILLTQCQDQMLHLVLSPSILMCKKHIHMLKMYCQVF